MFGYLLSVLFARALVNTTPHGWRPLFWFGACPPLLIIIWRLCLPENEAYLSRQRKRGAGNASSKFFKQFKVAVREHWKMLLYLIVLMSGFCFMAHASQDLYPILLENQHGFDANWKTVIQVMAAVGSIMGGILGGSTSQYLGRRLTIIILVVLSGALIYPYTHVTSHAILAAAFFLQFANQGAWGIIPVHLMELVPDSIRAFAVGTCYQLGNLASAATPTIQASSAERYPLGTDDEGVERLDYARVMAISLACIFSSVIVWTFLGPENLGRDLSEETEEETQGLTGGSDANGRRVVGDQQV